MEKRLNNWFYAKTHGYFWLPCPICGNNFGGHEWKSGNDLMIGLGKGKGVCPDCGEKAREINKKNFPHGCRILFSISNLKKKLKT